jgi:hypothetical protein
MTPRAMSVAAAQKIFERQRLRFGDPEQIEALALLALIEELKALGVEEIHCPRCNGTGYRRCLGCTLLRFPNCDDCAKSAVPCERCDGEGTIEIENLSEFTARGLRALLAEASDDEDDDPEPQQSLAAKAGAS